jgi:hypothetical protein
VRQLAHLAQHILAPRWRRRKRAQAALQAGRHIKRDSDLARDLGGAEAVTTQQLAIVDLAVKTKLILDSIDAWCFAQPTLINRRRRSVLPVVRERQQLADSLAKYMNMLGLERRTKPIQSLGDYVASRYSNDGAQTTRESVTEHEEDSS